MGALSDPLIMKGSGARAHTHTHMHINRRVTAGTYTHLFTDVDTGVTVVFRKNDGFIGG